MRSVLLLAVVVCLLATTAVFAQGALGSATFGQWTPRSMGMGNVGVGVADDAAAWYQNPAGLGALATKPKDENHVWAIEALGSVGKLDGHTAGGFTASGWQPRSRVGVGLGYGDVDKVGRASGVGVGMNYQDTPFSFGLNVVQRDPAARPSDTLLNLGLMYRFVQPDKDPLRVGLRLRDLGDEAGNGTLIDLGVAWPATPQLLFAADFLDLGDKVDMQTSAGAEYWFGPERDWAVRAGLNDTATATNVTLGVGYVFSDCIRVDGAWIDTDPDKTWSLAGTYTF